MTAYGFHASHEQIDPRQLLADVQAAEAAGFQMAMCSDHLSPWAEEQGESGFAWSWLGAALQATSLRFGVVTAPGQRYHPAVHAQSIATLGQMFPGRFWAALGSGEAMNEHVTGDKWPRKDVRNARLRECVEVFRALLAGEEVTHEGLVTVEQARIWSLPETPPPLLAAAVSAETAGWAAEWADGLATVYQPLDTLRTVRDAYRDAGGTGPFVVQVHVSYADREEDALSLAFEQWRPSLVAAPLSWDLALPEHFTAATALARPDDIRSTVLVSSEPDWFMEQLSAIAELGADEIYLHHVGKDQSRYLEVFGEHVLPALTGAGR